MQRDVGFISECKPSQDPKARKQDSTLYIASQDLNVDREDEVKPPKLPASVVAINYRNSLDDNRSISSQKSESGYYSSGALSDGPTTAVYAASSSLRSVGSLGSQSSGGRDAMATTTSIHGIETRYTVAISSYAPSEAAKSDIATVCSNSVVEDIDISSVDMNVPQTPNNIFPSPHSGTNLRRSVEFAPSSFTQQLHKHFSVHQTGEYMHFSSVQSNNDQTQRSLLQNDMGPPLSRALLMQGGLGSTTGSRAGSVRSFGSNGASQNSDVVAHVDTDDCGGSLVESVTDAQSIYSQEDIRCGPEAGSTISQIEKGKEQINGAHPLLKSNSSLGQTNGRTSPGGTIYKGKGVRRYQGRYMNLPLKRFNQGATTDLVDTVLEADKVMKEEEKKYRASPQRNDRSGSFEKFYFHRGQVRSLSPSHNSSNGSYPCRGRNQGTIRKNSYHLKNIRSRRNTYSERQDDYHSGYSRSYCSRSRSRSNSPRWTRNNRTRWKQSDNFSLDSSLPTSRRKINTVGKNSNSPSSRRRTRNAGWNVGDLHRRRRQHRSKSRGKSGSP